MDMHTLLNQARDLLYAIEDESATEGSIGLDAYRVRKAIDHMNENDMTEFTEEQIEQWRAFEDIRLTRTVNMMHPDVRAQMGITKAEHMFLCKHYAALKKQSELEEEDEV